MRIALIFPPATDPRAPQLALPALAAAMRHAGVEVDLIDCNLEGMLAAVRPERLLAAGRRLHDRNGPGARQWSRASEQLAARMPTALAILRDRQRFFDPGDYTAARDTLAHGLGLASAAAPRPLTFGLLPIRYDVDGVDPHAIDDLIAVTADRGANLFADTWEEDLYPRLASTRPDLVGITITNRQQIVPGLTLARALKEQGHFVVLGGAVYTKFARQLAKLPRFFTTFADAVVVYEGETALLALVEQVGPGGARRLDQVPNLLYLDGDRVRTTRNHLESVDALRTPDFAGLPLDQYLAPYPVLPILTGKGCYFNRCKFCDIPYINHISPRAYRVRSPEHIVEDLRTLERRFGAQHFVITDEALAPKLLVQLAEALEPYASEPRHFTGYARLEPGFTAEVCRKISAAGMRKLFFGLESASQATLDHMDKGIRVADAPAILQNCRDAGIDFHVFSMIGFPEENEDSARETMRFFVDNAAVLDKPGNSFDIHPFGLELRTRYFEQASEQGVLIAPAALKKDFVIGLRAGDWQNSRGIGAERIQTLLDDEFYPELHRVFRQSHNCPVHLWSGFEEYAILYADHYRDHAFPGATCLPDLDDARPFRLRWNPAALAEAHDDMVLLSHGGRHTRVWTSVHRLLGRPVFRSTAALVAEASGDAPADEQAGLYAGLRSYTDELIGAGLLQVELAVTPRTNIQEPAHESAVAAGAAVAAVAAAVAASPR